MLRRPPTNLNRQSEQATILLIREVLQRGIELSEVRPTPFSSPHGIIRISPRTDAQVYVDALGPTKAYEAYLSSTFPGINFTVTAKADSKFKIVGAASVAAKVTRDAWVEGWLFEEHSPSALQAGGPDREKPKPMWAAELGSGYPSGRAGRMGGGGQLRVKVADDEFARSEDAGVDKEVPRADLWVPLAGPLLVDDRQDGPGEGRASRGMVCPTLLGCGPAD